MKKNKMRYSLGSNIIYSLRMHWNTRKLTLILCAVNILTGVLLPFIGILLPKIVIDEITKGATPLHFTVILSVLSVAFIIINYIKNYSDVIVIHSTGTIASFDSPSKAMEKQISMDYELMEEPDIKILEDKAMRAAQSNHTPAHNFPRILVRLIVNILGFLLYGSIIVKIHPLILPLLTISAAINWYFISSARSYENNTKVERSKIYMKLRYAQSSIKNSAAAKDIRLYSMADWMKSIFGQLVDEYEHAEGKVAVRNMTAQLVDGLLILIRDGAAYAFLIYLLFQDKLSLGNFVFIFAAIGSFAGWISGIILQLIELLRASSEMSDLREYFDVPDKSNTGKGIPLPFGEMLPPGISLCNVGYTYPNSSIAALWNINLEIKPGERVAIVGANGAGKTTLVKMICGLYRPKTGSICLAGNEISEYNRDEYFTLFSTVFQDIHLLTADIACNISQLPPEMTDYNKVEACLRLSGMYEKVKSLPFREKTMLVRRVNDDAIELSGGEKQKLALARALYKNAPFIILDEPTAALDPIAESEIYKRYSELTKGKTSIYISHRLASTRFCDRIFFLDNHTVSEVGTHDELMRLGGKYAKMFELQSHYYRTEMEVSSDGQ